MSCTPKLRKYRSMRALEFGATTGKVLLFIGLCLNIQPPDVSCGNTMVHLGSDSRPQKTSDSLQQRGARRPSQHYNQIAG